MIKQDEGKQDLRDLREGYRLYLAQEASEVGQAMRLPTEPHEVYLDLPDLSEWGRGRG